MKGAPLSFLITNGRPPSSCTLYEWICILCQPNPTEGKERKNHAKFTVEDINSLVKVKDWLSFGLRWCVSILIAGTLEICGERTKNPENKWIKRDMGQIYLVGKTGPFPAFYRKEMTALLVRLKNENLRAAEYLGRHWIRHGRSC